MGPSIKYIYQCKIEMVKWHTFTCMLCVAYGVTEKHFGSKCSNEILF